MKPFSFAEPGDIASAVQALRNAAGGGRIIAGGSDLLGELKEGTARCDQLVSLGRIEELRVIEESAAGLRIGAGVTLAQLEHDPRLGGPLQILAEAARGVATPEIRNQGTVGGNLCQRPRCLHYRSPWLDCLKKGGSDCPALKSRHQQYLSIFGGEGCRGGVCHSAHPSDLAPALLALQARVTIAGSDRAGSDGAGSEGTGSYRDREMSLENFFAGPQAATQAARGPEPGAPEAGLGKAGLLMENVLAAGEVLISINVPPLPAGWRGTCLKARDRNAGDFALVSVAFGCVIEGGRMRDVRLVLGSAAPVPRRCHEAEALLEGSAPTAELAAAAATEAFSGALPLSHNGYKVDMGRALVARALEQFAQ